jgi:hypothetical protein
MRRLYIDDQTIRQPLVFRIGWCHNLNMFRLQDPKAGSGVTLGQLAFTAVVLGAAVALVAGFGLWAIAVLALGAGPYLG